MTREEKAFIQAANKDHSVRAIFADWLDEQGRHDEAAAQRAASTAVREVDLPELLEDYNWEEVFGEGTGGNCENKADACPPGASVSTTPPKRSDVDYVIASVNGENNGDDWVGVFRLRDGRYLLASGSCDYTGWV